jgi:thioredoxin-related protein
MVLANWKLHRWFPLMLAWVLVMGCGRGDQVQHVAKPVTADPVANATDETEASVPLSTATDAVTDATAPPTESSPEPAAKQSGREPIYDTEADGAALIAAAMERAKRDHKHVLIEWGGNWCGWCFKLHDVFTGSEDVRPIVHEDYELVLIDQGANRELMESYGGKDTRYAFPHLTILDADGNVLVNQETGSLEEGLEHDTGKVAAFLKEWTPKRLDAEKLLATALEQAASDDKCVLLHVGTPYCGWCRVLSQFLHDHEELLAGDYIDLKIDTLRMTNGEEVAGRFRPGESLGIPWTVILDASGNVLVSSVGPQGNCGYPVSPEEVDHFISMLTTTRKRMTDSDIATIRADLKAFREARERARNVESNAAAAQDASPQSRL